MPNFSKAAQSIGFDSSDWTVSTGKSQASAGLSRISLLLIGGAFAYFVGRKKWIR